MNPILKTRNLSFSYNGKPVLTGISLEINAKETYSIIGKNGSGKSTLIKCLAGLLPVSPNTVFVNNQDILKVSPKEKAKIIAYVPQANNRAAIPYTVFDYVMLGRFPYQGFMAMANLDDKKIVLEALELTDVLDLKDRIVGTLSGGEIQRVFIAAAVAQQSKVLLLDEPATFLDPFHQETIKKTLERIHNEYGSSIITITHDVNTAIFNFNNVIALSYNMVFYAGSTHDFLAKSPEILTSIFSIPFQYAVCKESQKMLLVPGELP